MNSGFSGSGHARTVRAALAISAVLLVAGCGDPRLASPLAAPVAPSVDLGIDGCEPADFADPADELQQVDSWWSFDIEQAVSGPRAGVASADGTSVRVSDSAFTPLDGSAPPESADLYLGTEAFDVIGGLAGDAIAGADATDDGRLVIGVIAIAHSDGSLSFVGNCARARFTEPIATFADQNGKSAVEQFTEMAARGDFSQFIEFTAPAPSVDWLSIEPRLRQIDVESTPGSVLESLVAIDVDYIIPESWASLAGSLCLWTTQGWNTCVALEAGIGEDSFDVPAYLVPGEPLELWLLDSQAGLDVPLRLLAVVDLEASDSGITIELRGDPKTLDDIVGAQDLSGGVGVSVVVRASAPQSSGETP